MASKAATRRQSIAVPCNYERIAAIDGKHPLQDIPGSCVEYAVRQRPNGKIVYFNFELAREMGLLHQDHGDNLTPDLQRTLLETFSLQIINEHDIITNKKIDPRTIKPNRYMATRYLQLQHPGRSGLTSGDGRSIWNGQTSHRGKTWDISSCGTGATCLSPATAINKRFFKTGDPYISYGCGYSDLEDGIGGAVFSEILHKNGLATERTLLVLEYPGKLSINVRACPNLLRPSHFFLHLKQNNYDRLKKITDLFIDRQLKNAAWPAIDEKADRYDYLLRNITRTFATMAAQFESEYIFCWLDWDGDNILADGGIIDYGSIRQFGLYHHEYRYDDGDRWSTNIAEQKRKARYIVQTFAQLVDFLKNGKKKNIQRFRRCAAVTEFNKIFRTTKLMLFLKRIGYTQTQASALMQHHKSDAKKLYKHFSYFEQMTTRRAPTKTADGITRDAVYNMREILRELPNHYMSGITAMSAQEFMEIIRTSYCKRHDIKVTPNKARRIKKFQDAYIFLLQQASEVGQEDVHKTLQVVAQRSLALNRQERVTGDAISHIQGKLMSYRSKITSKQMHRLISDFVNMQILNPDFPRSQRQLKSVSASPLPNKYLHDMQKLVKACREGL